MTSTPATSAPSGVPLSRLVFGGNVLGWTVDQPTSFALLDRLGDAGLTTIDTADMYAAWAPGHQGGESESTIGAWLRARGPGVRAKVELMTKVGKPAPINPPPGQGLSPAYIERAIQASLRRLGTDYVDVYFSHAFDDGVPQADTLAAYDRLLRAGQVRAIGASNFSAPQLRDALDVAAAHHLPRYSVLQPHYNLVDRDGYDGPLRDLAMTEGLAVVPYFSLASGFLTGKYRPGHSVESARLNRVNPHLENPRSVAVLDLLDDIAAAHAVPVAAVSLAWLRAQPTVAAPLASARTVEQLSALVASFELELSDAEVETLSAATAPVAA